MAKDEKIINEDITPKRKPRSKKTENQVNSKNNNTAPKQENYKKNNLSKKNNANNKSISKNDEIEIKPLKKSPSKKTQNVVNSKNSNVTQKRVNTKNSGDFKKNNSTKKNSANNKSILRNDEIEVKPLKKSPSTKITTTSKGELSEKSDLPKKNVKLVVVRKSNFKIVSNEKVDAIIVPKKKKKRKLKRKVKILLMIFFLLIIMATILIGVLSYLNYLDDKKEERLKKEQELLVTEIKSHYGNFVRVNKDTMLYRMSENNYYEYGMIYQNGEILLKEIEIDYLTEYFYSEDLGAYIKYDDLTPIDELTKYSDRYKNYIVFNENVITKDEFNLYDRDKLVYSFKESMTFPIIVNNDDGKYYVEFNNRLLYIVKDDIKEIVKANNTKSSNASKVTTLCYHRIYNPNEKCNDLYICKSRSNFEREMKYLSDNKFLTLTMEEMYWYLTKKVQVPKKSVVITFDDGYLFNNGIEVLEKYNLHGTGFIKTGAFSDYSIFASPNFELQSHTEAMHSAGTCPRETSVQQGGGILCLPENKVLEDLKTSREKLNGAIALAYPFYDYNTRAVRLVKEAGFKLAFIGAAGAGGRAKPGTNPLLVPRMTIWNTTTFNAFKDYVNN